MQRPLRLFLSTLAVGTILAAGWSPPAALAKSKDGPGTATAAPVSLPFEKFTLGNGLRVIVHTDRKAPVVAVGIWYHVGSKDERPGRTGFAHLFEHLMFQGTENYKGEWFQPFEEVGATDQNGTTWFDRTNYFQTVPTTALEMTLWLESDRMGHFIDSVDQAKLDEQREVVKNEKRQGDNQPYGRTEYLTLAGLFPAGHPYSWSTIGSMEDLEAASLADVKDWFRTWYGPDNAVLVLAGDIDAATARPLVEKYFGDIAAGPPLPRRAAAVPDRTTNTRDVLEDRVPQPMMDRNWAVPGRNERDAALLMLASRVLGGGKTSRLFKTLVYDRQVATTASASMMPLQLASIFSVTAMPRPGQSPAAVEAEVDKVVAEFLAKGPTEEELRNARTSLRARFVRGLEKVGGFAGKATTLAEGELYHGDPAFYATWLDWIETATPADVTAAANRWLSKGWHQVDVVPVPAYTTVAAGADRSALPKVESTPALTFPALETGTLANGIPVTLARRQGVPTVEVALQFDAGYAADSAERPGVASFALDMMDEGTTSRSALRIADEMEGLGAQISGTSTVDTSVLRLSALSDRLGPSMQLFADVVRNPAFAPQEMERLRPRRLAAIQQEKAEPRLLALRVLPPALYGADHAYGKPFTGSGTEASVKAITVDDLKAFHAAWFRPDNVRIFAAGDVTLPALVEALNKAFGDWKPGKAARPAKQIAEVKRQGTRVALIDRPDSPQTMIMAGRLAPSSTVENDTAIEMANDVFGGMFTSRVNMNLREAKGWSYGAFSFLSDARGQRPWIIMAPVQSDRTAEALSEIRRELTDYAGSRPADAAETARATRSAVRSLPGRFETNGAVLSQMLADARFDRPADHIEQYQKSIAALGAKDLQAATRDFVSGDDLLWVVIGDRRKIEQGVRALNLGPVEIWDADGVRLE
ncbi:M16 family metallopeptidase [Rhodospirillum centenum]|uniref:Peptidase, M16 family, putative n=1 Tax=Rhodospirillum centenum (strain ATCC 51521 / SW) TaxID=414684 RepID=B6IRI8_RHOCS|nr:pitrilysin family protein [Rhodospirillum centenum]ACI98074.1 peptidase, M16 family, putative [Rhodospirillum centenum SW]